MNTAEAAAVASPPAPGDLPEAVYEEMGDVLGFGLVVALALLAGATAALVVLKPWTGSGGWVASNPLLRYLDPRRLASGIVAGAPEAWLTLGVYALIATPVVRVATGIYAFVRHGERRMAVLTVVVLALVLVGLFVVGPLVR